MNFSLDLRNKTDSNTNVFEGAYRQEFMRVFYLAVSAFLLIQNFSIANVDLSPSYCEVFNSINDIEVRARYSEDEYIYGSVCIENKKQDLSFSEIVNNVAYINQSLKQNEADKFSKGLKAFTAKKIKEKILTYTKLPGITANKFKVDNLNHCIEQAENYIEFKKARNITRAMRKWSKNTVVDYDDTIPFEVFQANNLKLVLHAQSIIKRIEYYKKSFERRGNTLKHNKQQTNTNSGKSRKPIDSEFNRTIDEIKETEEFKVENKIALLENQLFNVSSKEPWLFNFNRKIMPGSNFLDKDYKLSTVGSALVEGIPEDISENLEFLGDTDYSDFLAAHPRLEKHFENIIQNKEIEKLTKSTLNKKIEKDLADTFNLCQGGKERLHSFPQLVESYIAEQLKTSNNVMDAYRLQGAYCNLIKEKPLDEKGLSSWATTPAIVASVAGSVMLFANPVGIVAYTAYGLVTLGGATLATDTGKTFFENLNHLKEANQIHQIGLTDLDRLFSTRDQLYRETGIAVAGTTVSLVGFGGISHFLKDKDKLIRVEELMEQNLKALSKKDDPNEMVKLVESRHDGTIHDYQDSVKRMKVIKQKDRIRSINRFGRRPNDKGTRNLLNIVPANYQSKEYVEILKAVRNDMGEGSDEAFEGAYEIIKKYGNYRGELKKIIKDGYLSRAFAEELKQFKKIDISERNPLEVYLPKLDPKTGKIISGAGDEAQKIIYRDPGVFKEDLKKFQEDFDLSFNGNVSEEFNSFIGHSKTGDRLLEQAELRRKIKYMSDELQSKPDSDLTPRQLALKRELRVSYKKPSLYPRDAEAELQEIIEKSGEYKEFGRIVLNRATFGQFGKTALDAPSKLKGKLAVYAGYSAVVGGGGGSATIYFDETFKAGSIGKLKAEFRKSLDVQLRSVFDATGDEKKCAAEWRGWSFRNACLIPLVARYLGVELAERNFNPDKPLLANPVARQKLREYLKFLLRLKMFDGTGEINQMIETALPKTAEEVGMEIVLQRANKVVQHKLSKQREELAVKIENATSGAERERLLSDAQKLLSSEVEISYRNQLILDITQEQDKVKRHKKIEDFNQKYEELAGVIELVDQAAIAKNVVEYGSLPPELILELSELSKDVASEDSVLSNLNFLNSPKLGED